MPSSKDVAKLAGVSQATVSRVLNTPELVRDETRLRVEEAIARLNYIPDASARQLVSGKTQTITLLSGPLDNPFFVDSTAAIVRYANQSGYAVNVHFVTDNKIKEVYQAALANKADGIIMSCVLWDDPIFAQLSRLNMPFVTYNRKHQNNRCFVEMDNVQAGRLVYSFLFEHGHRRMLWLGGASNTSTFANRLQGFQSAYQTHVLNHAEEIIPEPWVVNRDDVDQAGLRQLLWASQQREDRPTAIVAATDAIAIEVLDALSALGIDCPQTVSVTGIDNVGLSQHHAIGLTTVGVESEQNLGLVAIQALVAQLKNPAIEPVALTLPVTIFARKTTRDLSD
ncbi:MAG: LacI family DNA-binding transcriptional regulator [Neisseriaceae bacterium]